MLDQFGEPEHVFGPNLRFRVVAAICAISIVGAGVFFFLLGAAGNRLLLADWVSGKLAVPMVTVGTVVLIGTRLVPLNWIFVCPKGVIRTRDAAWDGISWTDVDRFEDTTGTYKAVTTRQYRLLLKGGGEWGFLADYISEYDSLIQALQQKVGCAHGARPSPG